MKIHKLALVGKNISHSKSKKMYEELLLREVDYSLLDFESESKISSIEELMNCYEGLSITAPYKKHFLEKVKISDFCKTISSINCIRKQNNIIEGTNTDYLAVEKILNRDMKKMSPDIVILGNGSMSRMTRIILDQMGLPYELLYRSVNQEIDSLDLNQFFKGSGKPLIINTCSRDFIFKGKVPLNAIFWDYNYDFAPHQYISTVCDSYIDGLELLKLQAKFALDFWSISTQ